MLRFFAALLCGVYTPQLVSVMLPFVLCLLLVAVATLLAAGARPAAAGLLTGAVLAVAATNAALQDRLPARAAGDSLVVHCDVVDVPRELSQGLLFEAACTGPVHLPRRVRLSWYAPVASVNAGDRWQFVVRLRPPDGPSNPGRRDVSRLALATGLGATGYVVASSRNRLLLSRPAPVMNLRQRIRERIHAALPHRPAAAAVVALATGLRHDLTREQWQQFSASGTNHLVAISGLHIGLVAAFAALLTRPLLACVLRTSSARRASLWLAVVAATAFAVLSGWGVPAQRACLMLIVVALITSRRQEASGWEMLASAGTVVLLLDSLASTTAGFLLSFSAVAVLLWQFQPLARAVGATTPRFAGLRRLPALQFSLFFGLLPMLAVAGQGASLVAPLVNLVAVPLFSLLTVPATLLGLLLIPLELDAAWFRLAALSVDVFDALVENVTPMQALSAGLAVALPALAWVLLPRRFPGRVVALLAVPALLFPALRALPEDCVDAHFLDVGQGTAVLVETRRYRLLYDTGPAYRGDASAASLRILPFMHSRRVSAIDTLVVSHADNDHAGGVADILEALKPSWVYAGEPLPTVDTRACHAGQAWLRDGIEFRFVYPLRPGSAEGNNASCVLEITTGEHRLLLTGDIERQGERELLESGLRQATVVSVPHHGSRTSSTGAFVQGVGARYAIVSAARSNRWGLPLPDIVARWEAAGSTVLNTGASGYLRLRLCAAEGAGPVYSHRERQRYWWQR